MNSKIAIFNNIITILVYGYTLCIQDVLIVYLFEFRSPRVLQSFRMESMNCQRLQFVMLFMVYYTVYTQLMTICIHSAMAFNVKDPHTDSINEARTRIPIAPEKLTFIKEWEFSIPNIRDIRRNISKYDVVVPVVGRQTSAQEFINIRSQLFQIGFYPGVEYRVLNITDYADTDAPDSIQLSSSSSPSLLTSKTQILTVQPNYKLIPELERLWPIRVPTSLAPLLLTKGMYNTLTVITSLSISLSFFLISYLLSQIFTFSIINSKSMAPTIQPRDVILVEKVSPLIKRWLHMPITAKDNIIFFTAPTNFNNYIDQNNLNYNKNKQTADSIISGVQLKENSNKFYKVPTATTTMTTTATTTTIAVTSDNTDNESIQRSRYDHSDSSDYSSAAAGKPTQLQELGQSSRRYLAAAVKADLVDAQPSSSSLSYTSSSYPPSSQSQSHSLSSDSQQSLQTQAHKQRQQQENSLFYLKPVVDRSTLLVKRVKAVNPTDLLLHDIDSKKRSPYDTQSSSSASVTDTDTAAASKTTGTDVESDKITENDDKITKDMLTAAAADDDIVCLDVRGDNPAVSLDSRQWGCLDPVYIVGTPLLRVLPLSRFGVL